jgi:hypothetical protein
MNFLRVLLYLVVILNFFSCAKPSDDASTGGGLIDPATTNLSRGGTDSTGGGNGISGKPLESYIVRDLTAQKYYEPIRSLIKMLSVEYPRLAADIYHISREREWYFVPVELDIISKKILGTYGVTEQYALQDLNKVWVNSIIFEKMEPKDQSLLILHELIMGIKLIKYKTRQDKCIAKAAIAVIELNENSNNEVKSNAHERYSNEKKYCRKTYLLIEGVQNQQFSLTSQDYDLIRKLVLLLSSENPDVKEVKSIIEGSNFRDYSD